MAVPICMNVGRSKTKSVKSKAIGKAMHVVVFVTIQVKILS